MEKEIKYICRLSSYQDLEDYDLSNEFVLHWLLS